MRCWSAAAYSPDGVIGPLAGKAGGAGCVKRHSEFDRLFISASVQLGKHQAGAGGCLASDGRSGRSIWRNGAGGSERGDVLAQLLSNSAQVSSPGNVNHGFGASMFSLCVDDAARQLFCFTLRFAALSSLALPLGELLCVPSTQGPSLCPGLRVAQRPGAGGSSGSGQQTDAQGRPERHG